MNLKDILLIGFISLKFVLHVALLSPAYDLHRDEYLHLDQAHHLAWGYLSVPPFTAWVSYLILLLGNSIFWVKFFPALFGALTILVVWKTVELLNGNLFALLLAGSCVLFSAVLRINILYQPNSFDILSWTTFYFTVINFIKTKKTSWLFIGATVFALGFLNKYNIVFLLVGLFPAILLSEHRSLFFEPKFYLALLLGLFLISPNIWWQYHNNFPVFHHLQALKETQLVNVNRLDFVRSQFLFNVGSLVVLLSAVYALSIYKPFARYRFFAFSLVFTLAAFIYLRAKDYYAIGIYPLYLAFGAVFLADILKQGRKKYLQPVLLLLPVLLFIPLYAVGFPNKSPQYILEHPGLYKNLGLLRWEDGKDHSLPQDYADMLGWKELAHRVDSVYAALPHDTKTLVLCDNYGQAGAINHYSTKRIQAVSFNADYINWFDLSGRYDNLIRIKTRGDEDTELAETAPFFRQSAFAGSVTNRYAREFGTAIFSFTGAKIDVRERIRKEISEKKAR